MGRYRLRDAFLPPGLVSLTRVPLAVLFPWAADDPYRALAVLAAAGVSDVLDGFLARRYDQATPTGAVLDGITDKLFVGAVVLTLWSTDRLAWWGVLLLSSRELGELPLLLSWALSRRRRRARAEDPRANIPGKAATTLQFAAVVACILGSAWSGRLLLAAGAAGALAAISYWRRELRRRRPG